MPRDVLGPQRPSVLASEDKAEVLPRVAPRRPFERLRLLMATEHHDAELVKGQDSCAPARFGGADHELPADVDDLLDDEEALSLEVEVPPA